MNNPSIGETHICRWKDGKTAAYSLGGDDSLHSQLFFAIPEMNRRGLPGTLWVNPGRGGAVNYKNRDDEWAECWIACYADWVAAAARGHDFGNHTLYHLGAASYEQAEQEIHQTAEAIWRANPRQRLQFFLRGVSTTCQITDQELEEILARYDCVRGRGGGTEDPTWEVDPGADTLRGYVDGEASIALLDYLVEKRDQVWCGTHTQVHKYDQERSTASVHLPEAAQTQVRLELTSAKDPRLYDYPLTLRTRLPAGWQVTGVTQDGMALPYVVGTGAVQYEARPGKGEIRISMA
jgi:hypothetical protein